MDLTKEQQELLSQYTKQLSGQLRGAINKVAREENEDYIYMILEKVFISAFIEGVEIAISEVKDKQMREEIIQGIVNDISKNTSNE